jgi:hypothetical protein
MVTVVWHGDGLSDVGARLTRVVVAPTLRCTPPSRRVMRSRPQCEGVQWID